LYAVDDTLCVTSSYRLIDYATVSGNSIYVKMFINIEPDFIDISKRQYAYEMKEYQHYILKQQIVIPEGFQVEYIPENITFEHQLFNFAATTHKDEREITISVTYSTEFDILPKEYYAKWNEMNRNIRDFVNQSIVLKHI